MGQLVAHAAEPRGEAVPAGQLTHAEAPTVEKVPIAQAPHEAAPVDDVYVPAPHGLQIDDAAAA